MSELAGRANELVEALVEAESAASVSDGDEPRTRAVVMHRLFGDPEPTVGRYTVRRKLGAGGMGIVYAAHDPVLDREVALKLRRGVGTVREARRLQREARAAASVRHPNVVEIFDVLVIGADVCIAMELVEGDTLSAWLRQPRSWVAVLDVLLQAGRGLAAAHAAGINHLDFKPGNVLVGLDPDGGGRVGRVRVTDFGLAGIERERPTEDTAAPSSAATTDAVVGTPLYMAPEQHAGRRGDARSDQFAFCVTTWFALAGAQPFEGDGPALAAAKEAGAIASFAGPSDVPAAVVQALRRGLSPEPGDRFGSMEALLAALEPRPRQRTGRALAVIAMGAVAVLPLFGAGADRRCDGADDGLVAEWDAERAAEVRLAFGAQRRTEEADRVVAAIDRYAARWREAHSVACDDNAHVPGASGRVACVRRAARQLDEVLALSLSDPKAGGHAATRVASLSDPRSCGGQAADLDPALVAQRERIRDALASAHALEISGMYATGLDAVDGTVAQAEALGDPGVRAEALLRRGSLREKAGDYPAARSDFEASYRLAVGVGDDAGGARAGIRLVWLVGVLLGDLDEGLQWGRHAEAAVSRAGGDGLLRSDLLNQLGTLERRRGRTEAAEQLQREALALREQVLGEEDLRVADSLNNLGNLAGDRGDLDAAIGYHRRSLAIREEVGGPDHPAVGYALNNLGDALLSKGELEEALALHQRALALRERVLGTEHPDTAFSTNAVGGALASLGRWAEAFDYFETALRIRERVLAPDHPDLLGSQMNVLSALAKLGRCDEARHRAAGILGDWDPAQAGVGRAKAYHLAAAAMLQCGDRDAARRGFERALEMFEEVAPGNDRISSVLLELGMLKEDDGDIDEAIETLERAETLALATVADHPRVHVIRFILARALHTRGREQARARELLTRAREGAVACGERCAELLADIDAAKW